jgi:hypothetical protein
MWTLLASLSVAITEGQLYGLVFLVFITATIFLILRRLGCSSCYYCKSCTSGFGRLAGWFFGSSNAKDLKNKTALAFIIFIYCLLAIIPTFLLANLLYQEFSLFNSFLLFAVAAISIYSLATWIKLNQKKPS